MSNRVSSKVSIPYRLGGEPNTISGILEQLEPGKSTRGRKLALILHGIFGHKDYLFLKRLAVTLPMDSFRFDFRGRFESPGIWRLRKLEEDVQELCAVAEYLKSRYGYEIDLVIGHSRGAVIAVRWICTTEDGKNISGFVNISGTLRMQDVYDLDEGRWMKNISTQGYHIVNLKSFQAKVYREDFDNSAHFDVSMVQAKFSQATDVLTIHGLADKHTPAYNAVLYARVLSKRSPGTYALHLMEHADHLYTGRHAEVVQTILDWWDAHLKGTLRSGIWAGAESGNMSCKL
ncbi:ectomycorrhiza-regulated esterase [Desarmillaria tabescens]|uniref:Ectomycorrhiza-regulated esterase n=1 Tax=Armillaria tabescens TaxID=1929756 RepID=A0AA39JGU8_ARMTA|nr:ectomycorrhiza-regulated esterase [Desarmillaria tabescens]KAK0441506.1 ectomycorrhiza-regulated esterase [Desarmillaria tabescens]